MRPHTKGGVVRARVTIDGRDHYLGLWGTPEADECYRRTVAQWLAKEGPFAPTGDAAPVTVAEVLAGYWLFAERYYGWDREPRRGDAANTKATIAIVDSLYATTAAEKFGPLDLRAVQAEMVRRGWCRSMVNHEVGRVKRIFRWAVEEEMVPSAVWHALLAFRGLRKGKTEAREAAPVRPVEAAAVEAVRERIRPALRAMIDFMLLTGCRPAEACLLRPRQIDRSDSSCWLFRPSHHKTEHHGHERIVLVGPKAQAVLAPYLLRCEPDQFVFSPRREEERRNAERRDSRKTPLTPSAMERRRQADARRRKRPAKERYTTVTLRKAIHRACERAGIDPWGPNRLRHTRATELRPHGLDVVGTILGHTKLETTQIYSEKNLAAAKELVARVG